MTMCRGGACSHFLGTAPARGLDVPCRRLHAGVACSLLLLACAPTAHAQLRPRRVGASALGETQEIPEVPAGNSLGGVAAGGDNMMADMLSNLASGQGLDALMNNPMLKGLMDSNPEIAKMMSDPEALQQQMAQMAEMMQSEEGQGMAKKMMQEMQEVLTDPDKLQAGLQQLTDNPALKGLADAVPGLRDVLDNPEAMQEQAQKTAELFQKMGDPDAMKEMLEGLGGLDSDAMSKGMEAMQALMQGGAGEDSEELAKLLGGARSHNCPRAIHPPTQLPNPDAPGGAFTPWASEGLFFVRLSSYALFSCRSVAHACTPLRTCTSRH